MQAFVCFAIQDQAFAEQLKKRIKRWGYTGWLETEDVPLGKPLYAASQEALKASDAIIWIIGPASANDESRIQDELNKAREFDKPRACLKIREVARGR